MKSLLPACLVGLLVGIFPFHSAAKLTRPGADIVGKFYVSSVKGDVTAVIDSRILSLKKGDSFVARGAIISTGGGAHATLVYSNGTAVYTDEKTRFVIEKFDQEFFAPNNNLRVEPSNSSTVVKLVEGRVVVSTPRLLSGTTMFYQTPHAAVSIRGEKVLIEASEKQTHVAMIAGNATVNPRDADGNFVSIGKRLITGQEAYVKYTITADTADSRANEVDATLEKSIAAASAKPAAPAKPAASAKPAAPATGAAPVPEVSIAPITTETQAEVVRLSGSARAKLPHASDEITLVEGSKLPVGTQIVTDRESELFLQPLTGVIADIRPATTVQIEKLSVTKAGNVVKHQSALLDLKAGTVVSTIDPALHEINDYGVRTPKGIAKARGTSFSASVDNDGYSIAATADTVSFVTPDGTSYDIAAGQVTITPAGSAPQPPVSLASAVASNPAFAADIHGALTAVTTVVQNNLGGISADSALDLVAKVAATATAALPDQATAFATQVVTAVTAPSATTSTNVAIAASSVTAAIVAAAPTQASQIAGAAAGAAPAQAINIAAGAAKSAPGAAPQIATTVAQSFIHGNTGTEISAATAQQIAALGAGITASAPAQAAPVAAALMQALAASAPQATAQSNSQAAATIAAAVTQAAPAQAVPVAATMMKVLSQTPALTDASPEIITQSAATLATSISSVVPPQTQEVATAVMQLLTESYPSLDSNALGSFTALVAQNTSNNNSGSGNGAGAGSAAGSDGAGGGGSSGAGTGTTGGGQAPDQPGATSIFITNFDPSSLTEATDDLQAAEAAQTNVTFNPAPDTGGGNTVVPVEITPEKPPPEFVVSPANG